MFDIKQLKHDTLMERCHCALLSDPRADILHIEILRLLILVKSNLKSMTHDIEQAWSREVGTASAPTRK